MWLLGMLRIPLRSISAKYLFSCRQYVCFFNSIFVERANKLQFLLLIKIYARLLTTDYKECMIKISYGTAVRSIVGAFYLRFENSVIP